MDRKLLGSETAKGGFANEHAVVAKINNWENDLEAQKWLQIMGYNLEKLDNVSAIQIPTRIKKEDISKFNVTDEEYEKFVKFKKADVQIKIIIQIGEILKIENLSLKKTNSNANFNQIDKRTVDNYQSMWGFDDEIAKWLKLFTGEILAKDYPKLLIKQELKETKRIFLNEMPENIQKKIIDFFDKNKILIISDTIRGRGGLAADWVLVTRCNLDKSTTWILKDVNTVMNYYGYGEVKILPRGSLTIGRVFLQRKGGTPDPTKLQFKFNPCDLFNLDQ